MLHFKERKADDGRKLGNAAKLLHFTQFIDIIRLSSQALRTPYVAQTCENNSPAIEASRHQGSVMWGHLKYVCLGN